jgi:hypothetical protein
VFVKGTASQRLEGNWRIGFWKGCMILWRQYLSFYTNKSMRILNVVHKLRRHLWMTPYSSFENRDLWRTLNICLWSGKLPLKQFWSWHSQPFLNLMATSLAFSSSLERSVPSLLWFFLLTFSLMETFEVSLEKEKKNEIGIKSLS